MRRATVNQIENDLKFMEKFDSIKLYQNFLMFKTMNLYFFKDMQ